jgi:serine/threonine protein kinase
MESHLDRVHKVLVQERGKNNIMRDYLRNPDGLSAILTSEVVRNVVSEAGVQVHEIPKVVATVCEQMLLIFAILIDIHKPQAIHIFIEEGIADAKMPLELTAIPSTSIDRKAFYDAQWRFTPYRLKRGVHRHIRSEYPLPIVDEERLPHMDGSFGMISRVRLSPELDELSPPDQKVSQRDMKPANALTIFCMVVSLSHLQGSVLILKRIASASTSANNAEDHFRKEIDCLQILRMLKSPNIVELLCSFTYMNHCHLIFPQLPMNLSEFLKREERFGDFVHDITFYRALQGLSSALDAVHNLKLSLRDHDTELQRIGYHHDLRPANILVSQGTFLLADFGLASIKDVEQGSKTYFKETKGDYFAPECQAIDFTNQVVSRPIDIWAFGCMIIDIATYFKCGPEGLRNAIESRGIEVLPGWTNFRFYHDGVLRPAVKSHMDDLVRADTGAGEIEGLLYVVELMLEIEPTARITSADVLSRLLYITTRACFSRATKSVEEYLTRLEIAPSGGPSKLDMRFAFTKLRAWGDLLGFSRYTVRNSGFDVAVSALDVSEYAMQADLQYIESQFSLACNQLALPKGNGEPDQHFELEVSFGRVVHKLVQYLDKKLQRQLESVWERHLLAASNLESTLRYGTALGEINLCNQRLEAMAEMKKLQSAFSELTLLEPTYENLLVPEQDLKREREVDGHIFGRLVVSGNNEEEVLVERIPYNASWKNQSPQEKIVRIGFLAHLLSKDQRSPSFRTLRCQGFTMSDSEATFKFLFELPRADGKPTSNPKTLYKLLSVGPAREYHGWKPDLQQRIRLAQGLVNTVHALHTVSWLHKNICSLSVMFFPSANEKLEYIDLSAFYLVNFRTSRPDGITWTTEGPDPNGDSRYHHPDYVSEENIGTD